MKTANRLNWFVALIGLWEFVSPFVLGYSALNIATWNAIVTGVMLIVLGVGAALYQESRTEHSLNWINVALGGWLLISSFFLGYLLLWNALVIGAVLIMLGMGAAFDKKAGTDRTLDWINLVLGGWLLVSPFVLGYSDMMTVMWNNLIVGLVVLIMAGGAAFAFGKEARMQHS